MIVRVVQIERMNLSVKLLAANMKKRLFLFLILFLISFVARGTEETDVRGEFFDRLKILEEQINCRATYQEIESQDPNALQQYIECLDYLVQKSIHNSASRKYTIQMMVTANDAKANDITNDLKKLLSTKKKLKKLEVKYIPFHIPYPGGHVLNDGLYYKVIVGEFKKESDAINFRKIIKDGLFPNYQDAYVIKIPL